MAASLPLHILPLLQQPQQSTLSTLFPTLDCTMVPAHTLSQSYPPTAGEKPVTCLQLQHPDGTGKPSLTPALSLDMTSPPYSQSTAALPLSLTAPMMTCVSESTGNICPVNANGNSASSHPYFTAPVAPDNTTLQMPLQLKSEDVLMPNHQQQSVLASHMSSDSNNTFTTKSAALFHHHSPQTPLVLNMPNGNNHTELVGPVLFPESSDDTAINLAAAAAMAAFQAADSGSSTPFQLCNRGKQHVPITTSTVNSSAPPMPTPTHPYINVSTPAKVANSSAVSGSGYVSSHPSFSESAQTAAISQLSNPNRTDMLTNNQSTMSAATPLPNANFPFAFNYPSYQGYFYPGMNVQAGSTQLEENTLSNLSSAPMTSTSSHPYSMVQYPVMYPFVGVTDQSQSASTATVAVAAPTVSFASTPTPAAISTSSASPAPGEERRADPSDDGNGSLSEIDDDVEQSTPTFDSRTKRKSSSGDKFMFPCPRQHCTKVYKNRNGLKYHIQKGICSFPDDLVRAAGDSETHMGLPIVMPTAQGIIPLQAIGFSGMPQSLSFQNPPMNMVFPPMGMNLAGTSMSAFLDPILADPNASIPLAGGVCMPTPNPSTPSSPLPLPFQTQSRLLQPTGSQTTTSLAKPAVPHFSMMDTLGFDLLPHIPHSMVPVMSVPDAAILTPPLQPPKPFFCKICLKRYKNTNGLRYHAKADHPGLKFDLVKGKDEFVL
ncbi:hypothetical protein MT418_000784 [Batrachochytrium dendrobatidis]